eukprot:10057278-Heterocapsa_arctica.AAC.1
MEEEGAKADGSEAEEEEQLPGARDHDMNKWQENDIRMWLEVHPTHKADAMRNFDKKLMEIEGTERVISATQELLSGRVFDTLIGSPIGKERKCKLLDMSTNSCRR